MTAETPEQVLAAAEAEATEADQLLAALEERVRDGDTTVQPEQVEKARGLARFAQLRRQAAQRRADQLREQARQREREQALTDARTALEGHNLAELARRYRQAQDALRALVASCEARNEAIRAAHRRLRRLVPEAVSDFSYGRNPYVVVDGQTHAVHDSLPGPLVRYMLQTIAAEHPEKLPIPGGSSLGSTLGSWGRLHPPRVAVEG